MRAMRVATAIRPIALGIPTRMRRYRSSNTAPNTAQAADVDKVLKHADPEHRDVVRRAVERAERARDRWSAEVIEFVDPGCMASVESAVRAVCGDEVVVRSWGGFAAAERRRVMICRSDTVDEDELRQSVRVLRVSGNFMFDPATHRDFLGAILGTGISRDRVGDIVVSGERGADVLCTPEMCEFLSGALTSVRTVKVEAKEVEAKELKVPEPKVEEIQTSEASTRLDALGSAGFRMSRGKFSAFVDSGDVKVNWKECTKGKMDLKPGDIISCRGKGRVEVKEIVPARKEGRFAVRLLRFV
jgi:photosystem II S4 domain protein